MPRASRALAGLISCLVMPAACAGGDAQPEAAVADRSTIGTAPAASPSATAAAASTSDASPTTVPATMASRTTSTPTSPPTTAPVEAEFDLEPALDEFVGDGPGGAIALVRYGGVTHIAAAGAADATGTPLRTDQPMRVGSIAKPFVAVLVMQLVDEQLVDVDEPLSTYLPEAPVGADVTIAELLSHRSGIPNFTEEPMFVEVFGDLTRAYTPDEMIRLVVDVEPGERGVYSYSNTNYLLLGQLIEALDGGDLAASLERRITDPLGLTRTGLETVARPAPDDLAPSWGFGDLFQGDPDASLDSVVSAIWASGALISTVEDLAVFLDALVAGELMSDSSFEAMVDTAGGYGFGIGTARFGGGRTSWGHGGSMAVGYDATMRITTDGNDVVVVMANAAQFEVDTFVSDVLLQLAR